uniref:Biotin--[acetyl-CoA-carboxylase] ligase n=1 Tax=Geoglobus ahangari TaxID=113653 RepID=A0A7C3UCW7_9EURY
MRINLNDIRLDIYENLKRGSSGETLAKKYGLSRVSIWKFVKKLEEFGYKVSREKGYKIVEIPDPSPYDMALACRKGLSKYIKDFYFFDEIDSTNRFAKTVDQAVVVAKKQLQGRGRLGRRWESPDGGLYMSISLNLNVPIGEIPKVTLITGLAVCRALKEFDARIKWPNDILIKGKKVSGILCEFVGEELSAKIIVGIGVNVKNEIPPYLRDKAASLGTLSINEVFTRIISEIGILLERFEKGEWSKILSELKELMDTIGKRVTVRIANNEYSGVAIDIDEDGALILKNGEIKKVISGECFYTNY